MKKLDMKYAWVVNAAIVAIALLGLFLFLGMYGCKTCEPITIVKDSIRTEIKAVPVEIPVYYEDSTYALLWLACNENNEVYIKESKFYQGKYTEILSKLENSKLHLSTKMNIIDSINYISRDTNTYNSHTVTIRVNELTKGQNTRLTLFWCFLVENIMLLLALLVYIYIRFKKSIMGMFKK